MSSRRLEKISKLIRTAVSEVIQQDMSDPRIRGLVSVTRVEAAADLRSAKVYLSILGVTEKEQELTLKGIRHAGGFIQGQLARSLATRTCPTLQFYLDDSLKKGFEITHLLDQIALEHISHSDDSRESGEESKSQETAQ